MANIPIDVASNLAQRLVDRAINEARYLCCFKSYVEDFEKEKEKLSATRKSVGKDIKEARQRNENQIDDETQQWLNEVDSLIQEDTKAEKKWFFGLCTNCIWQYGRGKEFFQKMQEIPKLIERRNNLVRVARSAGLVGVEFHCLSNFMHFVSRKEKFEELKEALKNSNNHLVGLQGMGGTGKTTMATQVGKEVKESKFFDKVIFTVVSNPPNVEKIRSDIAKQLVSESADAGKLEDAESLWSRISNGGEKILIILDDVWEKELDLKVIGIPVGLHDKGRCSVFLTTRDLKVCKAMGCHETIQVDVLPDEEALNLFLSHAVKPGVDSSGDFKDVALDIVKWCGGLPVAIEAIAKSVKSESLQVWKDTSTALQKFDPILYDADGGMKKAYNCLKLSYDNLKNEKAQKLFLLCSLFPEDFEIPVELLSRIAIGLGLSGEVDEYNEARRQVFDVKRKLVDSSLLLEDEKENVKMHDLVHEVATKIANKEIQVVRNSRTTLKENVRFSSWVNGFPNHFNGSKLEILIIVISSFVEFPDSLFEGMTKLRVLIINNAKWKIQCSSWVKSIQSLVNIRTLRLANLNLKDISSMGNLQSLETLELVHCSIVELPNEITKLENLRLLGLTGCDIERNNPFEVIEGCLRLQELYYTYNSDRVGRKLDDKEVRRIEIPHALQTYDIICGGRSFARAKKDATLLRRLVPTYFQDIFSESAFKLLVVRAEILELHGRYGTGRTNLIPHIAPIEDGGMNDLIQLSLESFPKMECLIHTKDIGSEVTIFAKLVELELCTMGVKELCFGPFPSGFLKKLEKLHLYKCSNLEGTLFKGKLDLGKLKCIKLKECSMSSLFHPSTAQSLKQLEKLDIRECYELKNIITDEGLGEDKVEDDPADPNEMCHGSIFSKLKFAIVGSCGKLEFILPISFVEDLPLLEEVEIYDCENLKHIFGQHQHEGVSYQKGKEIKLPSLKEMSIYGVPNFINIFPAECCHHPMSPVMKKSSTTKDDLKVKDSSLSCTFSGALICCFMLKSTATSIDIPIVYEEALQNCTCLQELKTQVFNPAKCFLRPPLDPRNLREMKITRCSNFTWLFTLSIASSMPLLEKLYVVECNGLKHLFTNDRDDDDKKYSSIFPKLKVVDVYDCELLESLFPASHFITLDLLKVLRISNTPKLRYVLGKCDCDDNLSQQRQLAQERCQDIPNKDTAKCLLRQPLLHLTKMKITSCSNWTSLFTLSIASSMPLLKSLEVEGCDGLKHIVTNEGDNRHDHMNYSSIFPNLERISVKNCSFLEYIFPASHCRSFNHLESVKIIGVNKLRYVFGKCYCEDNLPLHNQNVEIQLPALKVLLFDDVPNVVSIGTQNVEIQLPPSLVGVFQAIDFQTNIIKTWVLKVLIHCGGCKKKVKKVLHGIDGVYTTEFNSQRNKVTVTGNVDADTLIKRLVRSKFIAELWPERPNKKDNKSANEEVIENELAIQMKNNSTPNLTKNNEVSSGEGTTSSTYSEPEILSLGPLTSTKEFHEKESMGDQEALGETKQLDNTKDVDMEISNKTASASNPIVTSSQDTSPLNKERVEPSVREGLLLPNEIMDSEPLFIPLRNESPQDKLLSKEAKNETIITEKAAPAETRLDMHSDDSQNNTEVNVGEDPLSEKHIKPTSATQSEPEISSPGSLNFTKELHEKKPGGDREVREDPLSEKYIKQTSTTHLEPEILSPGPLTFTKELHEKKPRGDRDALEESISTKPTSTSHSELEISSPGPLTFTKELHEKKPRGDREVGEDPLSEKYIKPTCTTHSEPEISSLGRLTFTKELHEKKPMGDREALEESISTNKALGRVDKPANEVSSKEKLNKTALEDIFPLGQITVNQTEIDIDEEVKVEHTKPEQFEEDDLTRLFRIMEEDTDMGVGMPYIPNIAAVEDDNEVAKAFADLESSLKMDLNEIASSEEDSLRLQNALNFMSSHCSEEDGAPSHGISGTVDSLHQEIQSIISCFKQASSTVNNFTELEGKEKHMINEELPQRKKAANTLNSEIDKTEKSMAELKEQILRLQAELNRKEKEFKECEIKLSYLQEQKKESVWDNMGFMKEFVDVKKDRSHMEEEQIKARQDLEKSKIKWSSCVANLKKTTMLLRIYLKQKI